MDHRWFFSGVGMESRRGSGWVLLLVWVALFCLQAPVLRAQDAACDPRDLTALRGFLEDLDSKRIDGWSFNGSSSSSPTGCCSWPGVTCDNSFPFNSIRRVVQLDLHTKGIRGILSGSLAGLDHLSSLNLSNNSLRGVVPQELFQLQRLETLDLSHNDFSGAMPANSSLPSIRVFNISFNKFNGNHPILVGSPELMEFDVGSNKFSGLINTSICHFSTKIQVLRFSYNKFSGAFPAGFGNCTSLSELGLDSNGISGNLPDDLFRVPTLARLYLQDNWISGALSPGVGNLSNLVELDLSLNNLSGTIPDMFDRLTGLQYFAASSNRLQGYVPPSLSNLFTIQVLNLRNNSLRGQIDLNFTAMPRLSSLDLGSNRFSGAIPQDIESCLELKTLNLARNQLNGEIPESFKNLRSLSFLSLSNNSLTNISSALGILQQCPNLTYLALTMNFHRERMPSAGIQGFQNLQLLVIPKCGLQGSIPPWLSQCTKLQLLDLSWNKLEGTIPSWFGKLDFLFYLDLSNNSLTGQIPESLTQMRSLVSPLNSSQLEFVSAYFPFFSKTNQSAKAFQYNQVNSFKPSLFLSDNMLYGSISPQFGKLKKLHVLDLSRNNLSGTIPDELSAMTSLETLDLSYNNLTGSIPSSLTRLSFLAKFSVAFNDLVGPIPFGGQFSTFPNSSFEGNKGLCGIHFFPCPFDVPRQGGSRQRKNKGIILGMAIGIGLGTTLFLALMYLVVSRGHSRRVDDTERDMTDPEDRTGLPGSKLVLLFQNKDNKELTIDDILKSTNNFDQANIIGCGGFGLVYKATLPDGSKVAVKRLSGDYGQMEREFQAEVQTLSRAQHRNLVLLQGYCRIGSDRLLIYSYMENGSLDYWLHEKLDGGSSLDWDTRLQIAQGASKGLAYLHQSCQPHILHRDIKSSNILLDENFEAHLADFGLARLILPYDTHVTTDLVGTLGYIPPEYGQCSVATFKGDVYSFGVVLLELLTGKRPVDMCKPKSCRDLVSWAFQMKKDKREAEIFDPFIYDKKHDKQLMRMLEIACLCLSESPKLRPLTQHIVVWLDSIGLDHQVNM
uniref:non-specific serine/threonine protein kinase n=1 Tax=Anthurium amnicola TaxID=1678845 RepID=A0A1D1YHU8_9ARAE